MELTKIAGCWIKFCTYFQVTAPIITTICFIALLVDMYNDRFLPLLRQFFLIPNRNNNLMYLKANCRPPPLVLLGFDQCLVICEFFYLLNIQINLKGTSGSALCNSVCLT